MATQKSTFFDAFDHITKHITPEKISELSDPALDAIIEEVKSGDQNRSASGSAQFEDKFQEAAENRNL
jgi:hypothetical protein